MLVAGSLSRPEVVTYEPGIRPFDPAGSEEGEGRTVTLDARDAERWVHFDLDRGEVVSRTGPWELAFRRHEVRAADGGPGTEIERWYRYDFLSHLLTPEERRYRVPLGEGGVAELRFLSYYCPGPEAGCPTFRYTRSEEDPDPVGE